MILEACVGNLQDAISAQNRGAHQIELCTRLDLDGNSPPLHIIKEIVETIDIPVKIIVNPKAYDYQYTPKELDQIEDYIISACKYDLYGIVFGPINQDGTPDTNAIKRISQATSLPITFHKSIDDSPNILHAVKSLIDQNIVQYILTSGGAKTAEKGIPMLKSIKKLLTKSNIKLIAAGSITDVNLPMLHQQVSLSHYHGKLIVGKL